MVAIYGDNYHTLHKLFVYEATSHKIGNKFDNKCENEIYSVRQNKPPLLRAINSDFFL